MVLIPFNERDRMVDSYLSYQRISKSQQDDDYAVSKMQEMRNIMAVLANELALNAKDLIILVNSITTYKQHRTP